MQVVCKCKPSLFAYPPPVTQEAAAAAAKVPTAVLSTTARARDKAKKKEKKKAETATAAPASAPGAPVGHVGFPAARHRRSNMHGLRFKSRQQAVACAWLGLAGEGSCAAAAVLWQGGCTLQASQVMDAQ